MVNLMSLEDMVTVLNDIDEAANNPPKKVDDLLRLYVDMEWIGENVDIEGLFGYKVFKLFKIGRRRVNRSLKKLSEDDYNLLVKSRTKYKPPQQ